MLTDQKRMPIDYYFMWIKHHTKYVHGKLVTQTSRVQNVGTAKHGHRLDTYALVMNPHQTVYARAGCRYINIANISNELNALQLMEALPTDGSFSGSLVLCKTIVPESTVMNPQRTETMLLALWPDQSWSSRKQIRGSLNYLIATQQQGSTAVQV